MTNAAYDRLSTGNTQMDEILDGGFPLNSLNIIMGQPGTGKTVFAEQMVFFHAHENDRPILYLTTLSEPVAKVLTYLERFKFFDDTKIGTSVHYRDIGPDLAKKGIECILTHISEAIHAISPKIIVIDSFRAVHDMAESTQQMRRMLYELTSLLTTFDTTVFLVGEYTDEHARSLPEFAIADGIVQFLRSAQSSRDERFMRVLKLRGSGYLEGLHGCRITGSGMDIFPRLVTPEIPEHYTMQVKRLKSGISGFDEIVGGGFIQGSTTVVAGPTGSGKTTFSMQFALTGVKLGEPTLYVNFQENPTQLARLINALGTDLDSAKANGFNFLYASPVELQIDSIIVKIFQIVQAQKIERVIIDSIGDLAGASSDQDRLHDYLYSLIQHFTVKAVTCLLTYETVGVMLEGANDSSRIVRFSNMSDNIVLLGVGQAPDYERDLRCIKARGTSHDRRPKTFEITKEGICFS